MDMQGVIDSTTQRLTAAAEEIRSNMATKGINASGRTSDSIQVRQVPTGVQLVGGGEDTAPMATVEVGRGGGAVPYGFMAILEQWSIDKGLSFETAARRRSFAYLLARKIAREGTHRHAFPEDVYSGTVQVAAADIRENIAKGVGKVVISEVVHSFKKKISSD